MFDVTYFANTFKNKKRLTHVEIKITFKFKFLDQWNDYKNNQFDNVFQPFRKKNNKVHLYVYIKIDKLNKNIFFLNVTKL